MLCWSLGLISVVTEAFALFSIEYCDGEYLTQLYWGFWSILQVGSLIAMLGVIVQFWMVLGDHETPTYAVALGTPVLVFAALGWLLRALMKRTLARLYGESFIEEDEVEPRGRYDEEKDNVSMWTSRTCVIPFSSISTMVTNKK